MTKQMVVSNQSKISTYLKSAPIVKRFEEVVGEREAASYISSVLLAVGDSKQLQQCEPQSIATSAMRAAILKLTCDPAIGQAYLVPYGKKATFVIGYKGLKDMALRTGKYRVLNVGKIYEGMEVTEDVMTGLHRVEGSKASRDSEVIGYMLYFELRMTPTSEVYKKSFYMTKDEIFAHAEKHSKSYKFKDSPWKTSPDIMCAKTVLRLGLTRYGYIDPNDVAMMGMESQVPEKADVPDYDDVIEGEVVERSAAQITAELGFDEEEKSVITKKNRPYIKNEGDICGYKQLAKYHGIEEEVYMAILRECDNDAVKAGEALVGQVPPEQESML